MPKKQSNFNLMSFYDKSYKNGEAEVFTFFENGKHISEDHPAAIALLNWSGLNVLDVGCGTGMLVREISMRGASRVIGLDYSAPAIEEALKIDHSENVEFIHADIMSYSPPCEFDVIVSLGTLEHLDDPARFLARMTEFLADNGTIIIACPHFLNPRGYFWMALATLLEVPMSLSDLNFIHPWQMKRWALDSGMTAELVKTVDREWGYGPRLIRDYDKRLRNALRDANLPTDRVDFFMDYLSKLVEYFSTETPGAGLEGATALYQLRRS